MGKGPEETLLQRGHADAHRHRKRCSMLRTIREIQPTAMRYHLTPVRLATLISQQLRVLARMRRKGNPLALLVGMRTGAVAVERGMELPQKMKNGSTFLPNNPTSRNISKETQITNLMNTYVHHSIIYSRQDLEAAQMPISRWVDEKAVIPLHNGTLLSCKNEGNLTFATAQTDLESLMLSEISQSGKGKYHMISLKSGI